MVDTAVQVLSKEKEQQLQARLDTVIRMSRAKDQQISVLEQELQESQKSKSGSDSADNNYSFFMYLHVLITRQ